MSRQKQYSKQDCIESLQEAAEKLGKSPTTREYKSLGLEPSAGTIRNKFGWDSLKKEVGFEKCDSSITYEKPEEMDISDNEWENLSTRRKRIWNKKIEVSKIKIGIGCNECGFDKFAEALSFHHKNPSNKDMGISDMCNRDRNMKRIKQEISKCEVLCANCHRKHKSSKFTV